MAKINDRGQKILQTVREGLQIMTDEQKDRLMDFMEGFVYAVRNTQNGPMA